MPQVLNRRFLRESTPPNAVYVGRGSRWGNPYRMGGSYGAKRHLTRADALDLYDRWLRARIEDDPAFLPALQAALRGKDLVCWCAPLPCHAELLLRVANAD